VRRLEADTASGSTKPDTLLSHLEVAVRTLDESGSAAIEELVLNAMSWPGSAARANWRMGTPPPIAAAGYSRRTTTMQPIE